MTFARIWEFRAHPETLGSFVAIYGPEGDWARLFRSHEGYLRTELLRDAADPLRFVTLDAWRSRADYESFRQRNAAAYAELDRACTDLTAHELHVGDFESGEAG